MESTGVESGENACRMDFDSDEGNVGVIVEVEC
jgi:hypothetical protein